MDIERKMATVERIAEIRAITDADKICSYRVRGWWVTDQVGKYKVDQLVVYCEPDSWIPTEIAPFLSKGKEPREFNGIKGEKLRTVRLKKVLSQGLLLPIESCIEKCGCTSSLAEGSDVSEWLNITKWEAPVNAQLAGLARGSLPQGIIKTDQERIQNIGSYLKYYVGKTFEVTEKLDGSSATYLLDNNDEFHCCSRNLDLKFDENNSFWKAAIKYDIENKMRKAQMQGIYFQGEIVGQGIQNNQYKTDLVFYVYNLYDVNRCEYAPSYNRQQICEALGLKHVPVLGTVVLTAEDTVESILEAAEGASKLNSSNREGVVYKCIEDPSISFKAVSNSWLLKND